MYFESVQALLSMDGHGPFVWSAYAVCLLVIIGLVLAPMRRRKRYLKQLAGELKRAAGKPAAEGQ